MGILVINSFYFPLFFRIFPRNIFPNEIPVKMFVQLHLRLIFFITGFNLFVICPVEFFIEFSCSGRSTVNVFLFSDPKIYPILLVKNIQPGLLKYKKQRLEPTKISCGKYTNSGQKIAHTKLGNLKIECRTIFHRQIATEFLI